MGKYDNRKVRISAEWNSKYGGQIGTIKPDNDAAAMIVVMSDGTKLVPYLDELCSSGPYHQCELLPEEPDSSLLIGNLLGKRAVIYSQSLDEWNTVIEILTRKGLNGIGMNAEDYEKTGEWGNWNCISIKDSRLSAQGLPWFQKKEIGFTIIPADQFIAASTKSTTMNTAEQLQQLKADQQKLAEQIKVLEESIKNPYKVGDWVTLTANGLPPGSPSTGNNGKNKKGDTVQVKSIEINTMPKVDQWLVLDDGNGISVNIVRPATKEEIEEATRAKEVKVTIGNGNKQVTISRGKIVAHDSTELSISNVDILADIMKGTKGFSGWSVEFKTVKVGCVDGITYKQLKKIQDEYEKLTSI